MISHVRTVFSQARNFRRLGADFYSRDEAKAQIWPNWKWFGLWRESLSADRSPIVDRLAWVTFSAQRFMHRIVTPGSNVVEFGVGGSTLFFLDRKCRLTSVEHNKEWLEEVRQRIPQAASWTPLLREPEPDDGTGLFRSQFPSYEKNTFREYVLTMESFDHESLDIVMVDGRARVDAGLAAIDKIRPGGWLILDNSERSRYGPLRLQLTKLNWNTHNFHGPGPYADYEFWQTTFWQKPNAT